MWRCWSAVSLALLAAASGAQVQMNRQLEHGDATYRRLAPSLLTLLDGNLSRGPAVLIDPAGWFVAHPTAVASNRPEARTSDGRRIRLRVRKQDLYTQLVLLQAEEWTTDAPAVPAVIAAPSPGTRVLLVLNGGTMRGTLEADGMLGVLKAGNRLVPLSEIRFEAPVAASGGALLFTERGDFLGALTATLAPKRQEKAGLMPPANLEALTGAMQLQNSGMYGPASMTVGYTPSQVVLQRVIEGFRSPNREVAHPSIGVLCRNAVGGGALVAVVQAKSPAYRAGLVVGDTILSIGSEAVRDRIDFARIMFRQQPGGRITLRVRRANGIAIMDVVVGKLAES